MKFRADPKDWLIFILFSIFLLFLCSIGASNLGSFANTGRFIGVTFQGFLPQYIALTLCMFFLVMMFLLFTVGSYFFDREKGFGFTSSKKKDKGYSRWCTEKEMKKQLSRVYPGQEHSDAAGIPIINNGKELWVDNGEYHNLIIGSTGSGKTQILVQPQVKSLAKKGESMIITDPNGEIYEKNANELREKGYNIVLLNFRDPQKGNAWNPLSLPYSLYKEGNSDKAIELLDDLAINILYDESAQGQDPFWEKTSADYFTGLALGLFDDAKEEEINLNSINLMTTVGEDKFGNTTYIKEYYSNKEPSSPAYINVASTLMAPNETKSSILSVFKQKIKLFSSRENLSEMLSNSDFDMKDIGRKKTAVFIVVQDEKKTYHPLVTIFIKQCYETLIDVAQENGGKLPYRTNFILDEFANMPPLKDVTTMVTAARSRQIRFSFIIQNFAQLTQVYGKENGETIKGNCGNIIYLISSELAALEEISKMCGEEKSKEKDKTASTPLVTVSDLQRLPEGTIIVIRTRMMPFKTKMTYFWQMEKNHSWGKSYANAAYPLRDKKKIALFDLKTFVEKKKEEKIKEMLGTNNTSETTSSSSSPYIPPITNNTPKKPSGGLNMDELVKRIDARIAELEAQENKDKAEINDMANKLNMEQNKPSMSIFNPESLKPKTEVVAPKVETPKPVPKVESKVEIVNEPTEQSKNYVNDDQFFDDFFNDD